MKHLFLATCLALSLSVGPLMATELRSASQGLSQADSAKLFGENAKVTVQLLSAEEMRETKGSFWLSWFAPWIVKLTPVLPPVKWK